MYTRKRKPNWLLYATVSLIILFVCLYLLIKSEPIKVVVSNNDKDQHLCTGDVTSLGQDEYRATAGVIDEIYLDQSLLGDTQENGVVVTDSQQVFDEEITGNKLEEYGLYKYFDLSENDEYLLAKIVQCEAGNQDMEAKEAVVMVILNRVDDTRFPNTIEEVIKQNDNGVYQFSPLISGGSWYYTEPEEESYKAVQNVQYGISNYYLWFEGLYFESLPPGSSNWHQENLDFIVQYDDMRFYK